MAEPKHTPGPWAVHPLMAWVSPASDIEMPICQLRRETDGVLANEEVTRADANLIAAAPDLLRAAEMQVRAEEVNANCEECDGEGDWAFCSQCSILFGDAIDARHAALAKARGAA